MDDIVLFLIASAIFIGACACISNMYSARQKQLELDLFHENVTKANSWLDKLGHSLKCPDHYREEGTRLTIKVIETLRRLAHYSVGKADIVGSFGKDTDVIMPDIDLTLVVNHQKPPFNRVLNDIENVIRQNSKPLQINLHQGCKKTDRSFQFQYRNGIDVDLLPAANFPAKAIKAKIGEDPEGNLRIYSSSLAGKQTAFMTTQDEFTHTTVRLAKFWFKSLHFKEKMHGGSAMIEIIAAAAAVSTTRRHNPIVSGWTTFMNFILDLNTLKIAFEEVEKNVWSLVSESRLDNRRSNLVPKVIGESRTLDRECFVIDPANPFQDYLFEKEQFIEQLKEYAHVTIQQFSNLCHQKALWRDSFISTIFEPQPQNLKTLYPNAKPRNIILTCDPYQSIFGKLKVRNEHLYENIEIKLLAEALRSNLVGVVHTCIYTEEGSNSVTPDEIKLNLYCEIQYLIQNNLNISEKEILNMSYMHKKMDVKIIVPYKIGENIYAVRLSLGW